MNISLVSDCSQAPRLFTRSRMRFSRRCNAAASSESCAPVLAAPCGVEINVLSRLWKLPPEVIQSQISTCHPGSEVFLSVHSVIFPVTCGRGAPGVSGIGCSLPPSSACHFSLRVTSVPALLGGQPLTLAWSVPYPPLSRPGLPPSLSVPALSLPHLGGGGQRLLTPSPRPGFAALGAHICVLTRHGLLEAPC